MAQFAGLSRNTRSRSFKGELTSLDTHFTPILRRKKPPNQTTTDCSPPPALDLTALPRHVVDRNSSSSCCANHHNHPRDMYLRQKQEQALINTTIDQIEEQALAREVEKTGLPFFPPRFEKVDKILVEKSFCERAHNAFSNPSTSKFGHRFVTTVFAAIGLAVIVLVLESWPTLNIYHEGCEVCLPLQGQDLNNDTAIALRAKYEEYCKEMNCEPFPHPLFRVLEGICVAIFSFEYFGRLITSHAIPGKDTKILFITNVQATRTLRFFFDPFNLVDFISITPFYAEIVVGVASANGLAVVRVLRAFRVVRVLKVGRFSESMMLLLDVVLNSATALSALLVFSLIGMLVCGNLIYWAEKGEWDPKTGRYLRQSLDPYDPIEPSPFVSVVHSFWWVLATFTTVGYGDVFPTTAIGKAIAVFSMYLGVLLIALPITILGGSFGEVYAAMTEQVEQGKEKKKNQARGIAKTVIFLLECHRTEPMRNAWKIWFRKSRNHQVEKQVVDYLASLKHNLLTEIHDMRSEMTNALASPGGPQQQQQRHPLHPLRSQISKLSSFNHRSLNGDCSIVHSGENHNQMVVDEERLGSLVEDCVARQMEETVRPLSERMDKLLRVIEAKFGED